MEPVLHKFEAYLLTEKRVSQNTFEAYKRDISQLVLFLKGSYNINIKKTKREHLKGFLHHLKKNGHSARTMSRKISAIKVFFTYLSTYLGWKNVADNLIFPKLETRLPKYLTEQEIEKLFNKAKQDNSAIGFRNKVMLYLLYVSGMRISEMVNLTISQIQFDTNFINVTGKGGKGRVIPIPKTMTQMLKKYIDKIVSKVVGKGKKKLKNNYLFPILYVGKLKPISLQAFWIILKNIWAKTGSTKSISPHQLRQSLATHMLKNGVDLRSLQMLLGHENLSTVQIYTHLEISYLRDVYDKKHPRA